MAILSGKATLSDFASFLNGNQLLIEFAPVGANSFL